MYSNSDGILQTWNKNKKISYVWLMSYDFIELASSSSLWLAGT